MEWQKEGKKKKEEEKRRKKRKQKASKMKPLSFCHEDKKTPKIPLTLQNIDVFSESFPGGAKKGRKRGGGEGGRRGGGKEERGNETFELCYYVF